MASGPNFFNSRTPMLFHQIVANKYTLQAKLDQNQLFQPVHVQWLLVLHKGYPYMGSPFCIVRNLT